MSDAAPEALLDARGLLCPLPVLRARKALRGLPAGGELTVLATDPSAVKDFRTFCEQTGHHLVESTEPEAGQYRFRIRKPG